MKIGIISDIHNNLNGLNQALSLMGDVDELLCLGDSITQNRFSNEVIEVLKDRQAHVVLGNHEVDYFKHVADKPSQQGVVDKSLLKWLKDRPERIDLDFSGKKLIMIHSTPWTRDYVFPGSREIKRFADVDADYVLGGHTHAALVKRFGRALVINPGSGGESRGHNPDGPTLSCAVLDPDADHAELIIYPDVRSVRSEAIQAVG